MRAIWSGLIALGLVLHGTAAADAEQSLTFDEALTIALANNGDLYLARVDAEIASEDLAVARSVFIPRLISDVRFTRERQPGSSLRFAWTDTRIGGSLELAGRIRTGATYSVNLSANQQRFANPFLTIYDAANTTTLSLSVTQPLLRGAGRAVNLLPIVAAGSRQDQREQELRVRLEQTIGEVAVAYWSLALAHKQRAAREASLKLAEEQLAESTRLARLGTVSDLDVVEARAGVGRAQQQRIASEQEVAAAEGTLRLVLTGRADGKAESLVPADSPAISNVSPSTDEHIELALRNRPELVALRSQLQAELAARDIAKNELLPALDLVGSAGLIGFGGELQNNYATAMVIAGTTMPRYSPNTDLDGGLGTSFRNLVSGYYAVSVGLRLELPLDNAAARARHRRQQAVVDRVRIAERALLARIENEVKTSLDLLRADEAALKAADEAVAVHERLLTGMRKRFAAGGVTSFDVLRVSDELARAQIEAARARASYRVSLARLAVANGTLLQQLSLTPASLPPAP